MEKVKAISTRGSVFYKQFQMVVTELHILARFRQLNFLLREGKMTQYFIGWEYYFKCRSEQVLIRSGSDMALIKVNDKIYGVPISMPQGPEEAPKAGDKVFVLGWGRMCNERGILCSKQERKAEVLQARAD